ncbi:MAG: type II CRISPR RNA-guided endonuclease Cas9 [Acidobacteriota bacterium]|nr:type II CRISPR RNA-guided endonuclease Cas9 [Acidobacteriota bacterium]
MQKSNQAAADYVLGIDLGTNSLGWAIIGLAGGAPSSLIRCGARLFDAGMDGDIASGNEESRNLKRRQMRSQRRQIERRARRQRKIFHLLQGFGLLPSGSVSAPEALQDALNALDASILASSWFAPKRASGAFKEPDQMLAYILRVAALDGPLQPHYLGRALYHLAQRRGFKSNRKAPPKRDEKPGEVNKGINELREAMAQTGARTLGEYFARLDPFEKRVRARWTARGMYEDEFKQIWEAQAPHHPQILTPERRKELCSALFYQRPLWFPDDLVGKCELEPAEPRAPKYSFLAQRFRLLQNVNNLRLESPGELGRALTDEERSKLTEALELKGSRTFAQARMLLKLPKGSHFSIEKGGEKNLRGNTTTAKFYEVFGERWLEMPAEEHKQALHDVLSIQNEGDLMRRGMNHWKLDEKAAAGFAKISPEPDYFNLSLKAINRLLPLLENGVTYAEARRKLYPEKFETRGELSELPPLWFATQKSRLNQWASEKGRLTEGKTPPDPISEIRNPAVTRSLTEFRKVTNSVVREYGKPAAIRIELARNLKRSKKERQNLTDRNRENEEGREKMKKKILEEAGLANPSGADIRKALLHEECGGICPYTGKPIDFRHLFGQELQFDIEHIIPFERCFDNSFSNLTLCYHEENRNVKGKRTPWEAYGGDSVRYTEILDRVKRFHSPSARGKLWRFTMREKEAEEFVSKFVGRQLNDTRYASRLAAKYAAMLYGGLSDDEHTRRVHVTSGEVTAQLRRAWKLNGILNDGESSAGGEVQKTRDDHRHHAVDAVAIALTSDSTIQQLSRAAERAKDQGQRKLASVEGPWPDFVDSVRKQIAKVVVSHRVSRKVSGQLHEETIYSPPFKRTDAKGKPVEVAHVRRDLRKITKSELDDIVDDAVRRLVQEKLAALGIADPKKAFGSDANLPCFTTADGRKIPIKSVRVVKRVPARPLGEGRTARHVESGNNHHIEIYAEINVDGSEGRWDGEVVSMLEAYRRKKAGKPVVERNFGPEAKFMFSLAPGEVIECDDGNNGRGLLVVRSVSEFTSGAIQIGFASPEDARLKKEMVAGRDFLRRGPEWLRQRDSRKVSASPLGEIHEAHD